MARQSLIALLIYNILINTMRMNVLKSAYIYEQGSRTSVHVELNLEYCMISQVKPALRLLT